MGYPGDMIPAILTAYAAARRRVDPVMPSLAEQQYKLWQYYAQRNVHRGCSYCGNTVRETRNNSRCASCGAPVPWQPHPSAYQNIYGTESTGPK